MLLCARHGHPAGLPLGGGLDRSHPPAHKALRHRGRGAPWHPCPFRRACIPDHSQQEEAGCPPVREGVQGSGRRNCGQVCGSTAVRPSMQGGLQTHGPRSVVGPMRPIFCCTRLWKEMSQCPEALGHSHFY